MRIQASTVFACALAVLTYGTSLATAESEWSHSNVSLPVAAVAVLHPAADRAVVGKIHFRTAGDSLIIRLEVGGFVPKQRYRLRLHEYGDCSADKAANTGEPIEDPADLIEFLADEDGWVEIAFSHRGNTLGTGVDSLLGRGAVLHSDNEPVGCGTIGVAKPREALLRASEDPG